MGLGVALNTNRPVIVLDGDGAALMKMGNLATIGVQGASNLIHIILDNGVHDSTGGQSTVSVNVNFAEVACNCGYRLGVSADSLASFEQGFRSCLGQPGPSMLHVRIAPGSMAGLGRPTVTPREVALRFKGFLAQPQ
ncbi:MAG: thiamine pyrophosphate-dependent enzyme, partial [Gammaproteobacteria bacterium]